MIQPRFETDIQNTSKERYSYSKPVGPYFCRTRRPYHSMHNGRSLDSILSQSNPDQSFNYYLLVSKLRCPSKCFTSRQYYLFKEYPIKVLNTPLVSLCITTHSTHFNPPDLIGLYQAKSTHHDTPRKQYFSFPRSEVITVVLIQIHVFWNITLSRPEELMTFRRRFFRVKQSKMQLHRKIM